jgi:hypothetical protein
MSACQEGIVTGTCACRPGGSKLALIGLATEVSGHQRRRIVGLIDMKDGKILQLFPTFGTYGPSVGFARGGKAIWISDDVTEIFEFK